MKRSQGGPPVIAESAEGIRRMSTPQVERLAGAMEWDPSSFEQTFLEHFNRVVAVIFRLLGDRGRSEELASEAFWKLYRQPLLPAPEGNVAGWLYRTATNLGIDELRARAKRKHYEEAAKRLALPAGEADDPLSEVLREEKRRRVRTVLAALKPSQAQVLILRYSGFSYNELADCLGVNRNSVGTMLMRAEAEFQRRFVAFEAKSRARLDPYKHEAL
jgi:RNA polymerase sigma factor (sigma-70 family)